MRRGDYPLGELTHVLSVDDAQRLIRTPLRSIAAVRKSVRCWWSKRQGADMAGTPGYDPGCVKTCTEQKSSESYVVLRPPRHIVPEGHDVSRAPEVGELRGFRDF